MTKRAAWRPFSLILVWILAPSLALGTPSGPGNIEELACAEVGCPPGGVCCAWVDVTVSIEAGPLEGDIEMSFLCYER